MSYPSTKMVLAGAVMGGAMGAIMQSLRHKSVLTTALASAGVGSLVAAFIYSRMPSTSEMDKPYKGYTIRVTCVGPHCLATWHFKKTGVVYQQATSTYNSDIAALDAAESMIDAYDGSMTPP